MKVLALFQIYLPYFLPRTNEWSTPRYYQHFFDVEGQRVNVHPRKADEELFPNPIDKELSKQEIQIQSDFIVPSDAPRTIKLRDRCFDRIERKFLVKSPISMFVVNRRSLSPIDEVQSVHVTSFSIIAE